MLSVQKQTPPTQAASSHSVSTQIQTPPTPAASSHSVSTPIQTPPTQAAKSHSMSRMSHEDLEETNSSSSRLHALLLKDAGRNAETHLEDMFFFSNTTFIDLWDVYTGFDVQKKPEGEVKESAITKLKNSREFGPQVSSLKSYRWAPRTPLPGMMQMIGLVPLPEEGLVEESALPVSQGLPERILGLPIAVLDDPVRYRKPYYFQSVGLCLLNPLMLPVMEVQVGTLPSDQEWKLRDLLAKRTEKLRVLILLFDNDTFVDTVLVLLERLHDLLSDVTAVVFGSDRHGGSIYVIGLTFSKNRLETIAMLLKRFKLQYDDEESFVKAMSARNANNEGWCVAEATVRISQFIHNFVSAYQKPLNIYFSSQCPRSMSLQMKNELSFLADHSEYGEFDLSEFQDLRSLLCSKHFVSSRSRQSRYLRDLMWFPSKLTRFDECDWKYLSNLQCLKISGTNLKPGSRILLRYFPKLLSLFLRNIAKDIVVEFGHLPLKLNDLQLDNFEGSLEGSDQLRIECLCLDGPVCSDAYLQLCPISEKVEIFDSDIGHALGQLSLVTDQLKCLKFTFDERSRPVSEFPPFTALNNVFPLLESLVLLNCSVMLSAATFPRLHHLSLDRCDVFLPEYVIADLYGDSFPELVSLAMTNCKLLLDARVPDDGGQDPNGFIHIQADSLFSLKLINVSNLKILHIHQQSFPHLQCLQCHVANDDDFPFPLDKPGISFFPHLRILSLKKNALDGKRINLDLLADMGRVEKLELLDNAFFTLDDMKPIQCCWVHLSSAVVKHEIARRFSGLMPVPMELSAEMVTFAIGLVSEQCEKLIIDRHLCLFRDRANMDKWCPPMYGFTESSTTPT